MPVQAYWTLRDEYFIAHTGEDDYDDWFEAAIPHYQFLKRMWWNHQEMVRRFHTSKRLREMSGYSIIIEKIEIIVGFKATPATADILHIYAQGFYDSDNDQLGFVAVNWSEVGGNSNDGEGYTQPWSGTITTTDYPELGEVNREVYLLDAAKASPERIADYDGKGSYAFDIEMTPGRVVWLLMGEDSRSSIMGLFNPVQTIMGGFPVSIDNQLITCSQNTDRTIGIPVFDDADDPLDISAITGAVFIVSTEDGGGTVMVTKTLGAGITLGAENYVIDVTLGVLDTAFAAAKYWFLARIILDGDNTVIARGRFLMKANA
ncbi:MAG: hypothetical protein ABGX16_25060 [Pirellulales bacterium]